MSAGPQRVAGWQRALRWLAWLTFLGLAVAHSGRNSFGPTELLALAAAIGVSIWCTARPLGGPEVSIDGPAAVRGAFVSRTNWALLLIGAILTIGGIGATGAIGYDLSTGRATVRDVLDDMATFVVGWFSERVAGPTYDAHLEDTHAYILIVLLLPGLLLIAFNLAPLFKRGRAFRVEPDASVSVHGPGGWLPIAAPDYPAVAADGTTIRFTPATGGRSVVLPQARVFCRDNGARLRPEVSAEFFGQWLSARGHTVEVIDAKSFRARLTA